MSIKLSIKFLSMWPYSVPSIINLSLEDEIIQIECSKTDINLPALILTPTSINLIDQRNQVLLAKHQRSKESIDKYGLCIKAKRNYQDNLIIISTDMDFLLIYTIIKPGNGPNDEVLTIYGNNGNVLQNGIVNENLTLFFIKNELEDPIWKYQLHFKLFLKISYGIIDFTPLNQSQWLLITKSNAHLLELNSDYHEFVKFDIKGIIKKVFNYDDLFIIINENNQAKLFIKKNKKFENFNNKILNNVENISINLKSKILAIQKGNYVEFYNYAINSIVKTIKFDDIKSIKWIDDNLFVQKSNSWLITSIFGGKFFTTQDYDYEKGWLTNVKLFDVLPDQSSIMLSDSKRIFHLQLFKILDKQINHNIKRPIIINGSEVRIYSGYEMNVFNSNKVLNWTIIKIPYEQAHQLPGIKYGSISQDFKFLALSNSKALLIYSFVKNDWSFYINDFNHDLQISNLVWYTKLNLLIITQKTKIHSELIIFDFKKFNTNKNFDSSSIIFKYDFDMDIKLLNVLDDDLILLTQNYKYYYFQIKLLFNNFKVELLKNISFEKILNPDHNLQNIIKIDNKSNDLILLENNEVILLKEVNKSFEKLLLFDKVEFICKLDPENYYIYNGESLLLIKNFKKLLETKNPSNNVLKINTPSYPIVLIQEKGLFVTLENELINKKSIELNNLKTQNSIFLHELIWFELQIKPAKDIYNSYSRYKNFQYALELLLYQTVINEQEIFKLSELIKINPIVTLTIVPKCLRKIEMKYWETVLQKLSLTPKFLIEKSIELKQFKTLGNLIIIFLNHENDSDKFSISNEIELVNILKLIINNANNDDELWDTASELVRFFKLLDPSRKLLQRGIEVVEQ